jgi:hypothetical protein
MHALTGSLLTHRLGSRVLTAADVTTHARSVSAHGFPASFTRSMRQLHLPRAGQRRLRTLVAGVSAKPGTRVTYRKLVTYALSSSAAMLRKYAANLRAYAARVRKAPVSSNAS